VIDVNGHSSGLVQSLSLPPLQTIPKYFTGSHTYLARHVLSFDLLVLESVSMMNIYLFIRNLIRCFSLTAMLTSNRMGSNRSCKDTNPMHNSQLHAHNATL
jgi:hypothetical protein